MRVYDNKHWISVLLSMHKSDTLKTLGSGMIAMAVYAGIVAYLEIEYFKIDKDSSIRNISLIHTLLGFVLSMLLVFRTNTAYDRWWEGRKLLGKMVNDSRNLAIKLHAILPAIRCPHTGTHCRRDAGCAERQGETGTECR